MKHTPGPWKITHRLSLGLIQPVVENADGFRLATVNAVGDKETVEANTRLISLSPTMAEELIELAEYWRNGTPVHAGSEVAVRVLKLVDGLLNNNA